MLLELCDLVAVVLHSLCSSSKVRDKDVALFCLQVLTGSSFQQQPLLRMSRQVRRLREPVRGLCAQLRGAAASLRVPRPPGVLASLLLHYSNSLKSRKLMAPILKLVESQLTPAERAQLLEN